MSQLHRECKDRRNGSQLGFRLFFTTLERQEGPCHFLYKFLYQNLPTSVPLPCAPTSVLQTSWSLWSPLVL